LLKEKAMRAGAASMLHKPVDGEELIALIESLLPVRAQNPVSG
jgi:DNA-binding response OmpR family regulator